MVKLSVIIPVYNVYEYLNQCLDSIIAQDYDNYELILVDDGSTDGSGELCNQYAANYKNAVVYHKENGGLSSARNYGINRAEGSYLCFIDSDDWIKPTMLSILMNEAENNSADVVACGFIRYYSDNDTRDYSGNSKQKQIFSGLEAKTELYTNFSACGKIYRRELFDHIRFPEGKLYEDARTMYLLALEVEKYVLLSYKGYYYRQRPSSIMGTFSPERFADRLGVWDEIFEGVKDCFPVSELENIRIRQEALAIELLKMIVKSGNVNKYHDITKEVLKKVTPDYRKRYSMKDKMVVAFCRAIVR